MSEEIKRKQTVAVRGGQQRTPHGEHAEALYFTSGYVFDNAAQAAARFAGDQEGPTYGRLS
ncbi:MAG: PLP-dependent transferase, partial [Methylococcales bacterium]|nr:PLP-dependent transferase [Methylococcales bacterium]